ncbi:MAG: YfhO family protein [Clostridia bacterium]|nr:YfhO family protein [Clostridia bacterium]
MTDNSLPTENISFSRKEKLRTPLAPRTGVRAFWNDFILNKKYLLICFAVPSLITLLMYVCFQVYPIGEASVLVLDLNGQYVYFFEGLRDILHGDGSLLYSFSRALGGEFVGIFAYYLSSPFSFIVALFPKEMITEALLLMFLLKVGCCGLTFGIYIEATRKRNRVATVIFSTMYALCGYAVVMQHNTMWTDNLILLPIIMLGIENLIKYGKYRMFVISLAMAVFSNFYIGYMTCIFVALYFFYFYFASSKDERNPRGEKLHFIKSSARMALYSIITIAICSALLICTYYGLTFGKTTFSSPNIRPDQKFDWLDLIPKLFIGSYDTVRPEGLPFLYSGTLTLMLLPLYFFSGRIKAREKIASAVLIIVFLASFNVSTIDLFWHGMQRPNWLNYRYSFILCFFLILLAYKAYENIREIGYRKLIPVSAFLVIILLIIQKAEYENVHDFFTVWLSMGIIAVYLCVMKAVSSPKIHVARPAAIVLAILVCTEMFGGGLLNMNSLGLDVVYSTRTSYRTFVDGLTPSVEAVKAADPSFYRMEKTVHRKTNDNFALDINGLSNSTSTLNAQTIKLLNNYGLSAKSHWTKYLGGTAVSDTLFGIKYVIAKHDDDRDFRLYKETPYGDTDYTVWENPYAMSLAAGVSSTLESLNVDDYSSAPELMNATVTAMLGSDETIELFTPTSTGAYASCDNAVRTSVAGHAKYSPQNANSAARFTFSINVESEDPIFLFIPTDYPRECYLYINGLKSGSCLGNETDRIIEIGSYEIGETVTVSFEIIKECAYLKENDHYFYYLDSQLFEEVMPALSDSPFMIHEYNDDYFKGTITISEGDELVYTSIPYDQGWRVYCDGERVELKKLLGGLIGFELSEGEHVLELKYRPNCLYFGFFTSCIGGFSFALAWFLTELHRHRMLQLGVPVYEIPDRGDWTDELSPVLPDPEAYDSFVTESGMQIPNSVDLFSASAENDSYADAKYPPAPSVNDNKKPAEDPPCSDSTNPEPVSAAPCKPLSTGISTPGCHNCAKALRLPDGNLLCTIRGIVPEDYRCKDHSFSDN